MAGFIEGEQFTQTTADVEGAIAKLRTNIAQNRDPNYKDAGLERKLETLTSEDPQGILSRVRFIYERVSDLEGQKLPKEEIITILCTQVPNVLDYYPVMKQGFNWGYRVGQAVIHHELKESFRQFRRLHPDVKGAPQT